MVNVVAAPMGIDFPFQATLEFPRITLHNMFLLTEAFDFFEVMGATGTEPGRRRDLYVDVLEVKPTSMTIRIVPTRAMPYGDMAKEFEDLVAGIGRRFKLQIAVTDIQWSIDQPGIASDLRGRLHKVK